MRTSDITVNRVQQVYFSFKTKESFLKYNTYSLQELPELSKWAMKLSLNEEFIQNIIKISQYIFGQNKVSSEVVNLVTAWYTNKKIICLVENKTFAWL